jgi:hypothetical protein
MPATGSNSGNFWLDVQVDDTAPIGFTGSRRLWPGAVTTNPQTVPDSSVNYSVATEFILAQYCTLNAIWYYSPAGTVQLATAATIWQQGGSPASGIKIATATSPSWSGAAGSGWVSCSFAGVTLPAGDYKVSVYNSTNPADGWSAKDASTNYWDTGIGGAGITTGPLTAPGLAAASQAYNFVGAGAGNTPPYSDNTGATERGQCTFYQPVTAPGSDQWPYLYVDGLAQNYWVDVEVTPATPPPAQQYVYQMRRFP